MLSIDFVAKAVGGGRSAQTSVPSNSPEISKTIATPLYVQVAQQLFREIMSGNPPIGSAIPPETELAQRFGVSRITLRKAISLLLGQGLLSRRHGKGTFVESRPIDYELGLLRRTTQVPTTQGRPWHSRVVSFADQPASAEIVRILDLKPRAKVRHIRRIDYSDLVPVAIADVQLPLEVAKHLTRDDIESRPIYSLLRANAGIAPDFAIQTICAAKPSKEVAAELEIARGEPITNSNRHF